MRYLAGLLLLVAYGAAAQNSVTLTERTQIALLRGSSTVAQHTSWDACLEDAKKRARSETQTSGTRTFSCQTERRQVIATYSPVVTPPTPVDCVVSDWTLGTPQPATCPVSGQQTRVDTRTVLTQPANGGAACPPLTQTVVVPCVFVPPQPGGGTITNGQSATVTGSGFGTKPSAPPVVFDNFETGTGSVNGKAGVAGRWTSCDWGTTVTYADHEGAKVARHAFGGVTYNSSLCVDVVTSAFVLDVWVKGVARSNPSRNWKVWRTYDQSGNNENGNIVYYCVGGGVDLGGWKWLEEAPPPKGWIHYQVVSGPSGTAHYRNGKLDFRGGTGRTIGQMRLGHYWGLDGVPECGSNPGGDVYSDDAYFDTSIARVYLANAPTFDASTLTAIQVPTSWADGRIDYRANTNRFNAGDTVYEIVFTAGNVERAGRRLTVN